MVSSLAMRQIIRGSASKHQTAEIFYDKLILVYNSLEHEIKEKMWIDK